MRIFAIIISLIAFLMSLDNYIHSSRTLKKLQELDNVMFQYMKDEHNEKVRKN